MFASELPTENDHIREARAADVAAAGVLAFVGLSLASIGWATFVLPSVRSISPDQLTTAARAASLAPVLLALGGAHGVAAALALSNRRRTRRLLAFALGMGAIAASAVALLSFAGNPLTGWSGGSGVSIASVVPVAAAAVYTALGLAEHRATFR